MSMKNNVYEIQEQKKDESHLDKKKIIRKFWNSRWINFLNEANGNKSIHLDDEVRHINYNHKLDMHRYYVSTDVICLRPYYSR